MDLVFEYDNLCKINSPVVDRQFVGVATGLKTRRRVFQLLRQAKTFLNLLEQDKKDPGVPVETPHRRIPLKVRVSLTRMKPSSVD
jgi:hypothetical protein